MAATVCVNKLQGSIWLKVSRSSNCLLLDSSICNFNQIFRKIFIKTAIYRLNTLPYYLQTNINTKVCLSSNYKRKSSFPNVFYTGCELKHSHILSVNSEKESRLESSSPVRTTLDIITRCFSDGREQRNKPFRLMDFPEIVWPSVVKTLRNWILARLIITPYFDHEFNLHEFAEGSKQAVEVVSGYLSNGNYEALQGLVTNETLQEVKSNIAEFSMQQRLELALSKEDIYFSFPYQIGVMFNDNDQQRFVEITMCYHVLKGLKELREQGITPPINMGVLPEYRDKLQICNYRFVREFTKGVNDQWTINVVNHFKPAELER
ncbi:unnamed protein product [Timema podura]|uniref:Juvenile hormone esterase binding protein n=1 Tax=Timema podura TaxID=61482 RepID=A0ABN7NFP1_TIMPD|nr:unnamed protein product [Timema podura]